MMVSSKNEVGMLTDLDLSKVDSYSEKELVVLANSINAFLTLDDMRVKGLISGGPSINRDEMHNLLVYCKDRSVEPDSDPQVLEQYIIAITESM